MMVSFLGFILCASAFPLFDSLPSDTLSEISSFLPEIVFPLRSTSRHALISLAQNANTLKETLRNFSQVCLRSHVIHGMDGPILEIDTAHDAYSQTACASQFRIISSFFLKITIHGFSSDIIDLIKNISSNSTVFSLRIRKGNPSDIKFMQLLMDTTGSNAIFLDFGSTVLTVNQVDALSSFIIKYNIVGLNMYTSFIPCGFFEAIPMSKLHALELQGGILPFCPTLGSSLAMSKITELTLNYCHIQDSDFAKLSPFISKMPLVSLNLAHNYISSSEEMAQCIMQIPTLQVLNLGSNQFVQFGAQFFNMLNASQLTGLGLASNQISDSSALAIAQSLPDTKLKVLDLRENQMTKASRVAINEYLGSTSIVY